jgi:hypothetical protein
MYQKQPSLNTSIIPSINLNRTEENSIVNTKSNKTPVIQRRVYDTHKPPNNLPNNLPNSKPLSLNTSSLYEPRSYSEDLIKGTKNFFNISNTSSERKHRKKNIKERASGKILKPQNNGSFEWVKKPSMLNLIKEKFTRKKESTLTVDKNPILISNLVSEARKKNLKYEESQ